MVSLVSPQTPRRRRMSKLTYRSLFTLYMILGCVIPYYVMRRAMLEDQEQEYYYQQQQQQKGYNGQQFYHQPHSGQEEPASIDTIVFPKGSNSGASESLEHLYQRRPFFEEIFTNPRPGFIFRSQSSSSRTTSSEKSKALQDRIRAVNKEKEWLDPITRETLLANFQALLERPFKHKRVKQPKGSPPLFPGMFEKEHQIRIRNAINDTMSMMESRYAADNCYFPDRIVGTRIMTDQATIQFRGMMDKALNQGRWIHEPERDYPDFGGAIGWNKKKHNEIDRDLSIDRAPFPEAGKYHWEPHTLTTFSSSSSPPSFLSPVERQQQQDQQQQTGWFADRINPSDFCQILGPRHIILVGDLVHWQLHDSILHNMFDHPQACYGDLACHLGVGHPLCPMPNDVRLKFVRNDILSSVRPNVARQKPLKSQNPVEVSWTKDLKLKDTIILGAPHQPMMDKVFRKSLINTLIKIRKAKPDMLIIYRNNPIGHPNCPSKANGFNKQQHQQQQEQDGQDRQDLQQSQQQQDHQASFKIPDPAQQQQKQDAEQERFPQAHPFQIDPSLELKVDLPLEWSHYDRQNEMARVLVEATGGIYWNVATMTNQRPDGHVGGQDCLAYRRPGPTDEWAVSLYNLFKTIEAVEKASEE